MKRQIERAFPQAVENDCLQTLTVPLFYICDTPERRCETHFDLSRKTHFVVENPRGSEVYFLAIDHCLFTDTDQTRCDFAVFDSKCFCFVEIKETKTLARRSEHLRKARHQLLATIILFRERLTFTTPRIEAYACVGDMWDESLGPFPAKRAREIEVTLDFEQVGVVLYEKGNRKKFQ